MPSEQIEYFVTFHHMEELHCRCSIGFMSEEEARFFILNSGIIEDSEYPYRHIYTVESNHQIPKNTEEEIAEHSKALGFFEEDYSKYVEGLEDYAASTERCINEIEEHYATFDYVIIMEGFQQYADEVRKMFRSDTPQEEKEKENKTKQQKSRKKSGTEYQSIYETEVKKYLDNLEEKRANGWVDYKELKRQRGLEYIAQHFKEKLDRFKNKNTLLPSIIKGIKGSLAWKNRKKTYEQIYVRGTFQNRLEKPSKQNRNTKQLSAEDRKSLSKVRHLDPKYEDAVNNFLTTLHSQVLGKHITHEQYIAIVDNLLTPEYIAKHLKSRVDKFMDTEIETIEDGVKFSEAWKDREKTLDSDRFRHG